MCSAVESVPDVSLVKEGKKLSGGALLVKLMHRNYYASGVHYHPVLCDELDVRHAIRSSLLIIATAEQSVFPSVHKTMV